MFNCSTPKDKNGNAEVVIYSRGETEWGQRIVRANEEYG